MVDALLIASLLAATVTAGTSILYGTLGAIVVERAGVNMLGVEGLMLVGAFAAFTTLHYTQSLVLAVLMAFIAAAMLGSIHAFLCVTLKGNQIVSGLALTMFGIGITAMFGKPMIAKTNKSFDVVVIPVLNKIPILGKAIFSQDVMVYSSFVLVLFLWYFFSRTRWGLYLRTVGQNPAAADTSGVNVGVVRFIAVMVGCGISGLGGAYLSLFYIPFWTDNMTAGRGWIAVALVIFSGWSTNKAIIGAYFFGGIVALQLHLQALGTGTDILKKSLMNLNLKVYGSFLLVFILWYLFTKTTVGAGMKERWSAGVPPTSSIKKSYVILIFYSFLAAIGGVFVSLVNTSFWQNDLTFVLTAITVVIVASVVFSANTVVISVYIVVAVAMIPIRMQLLGYSVSPHILSMTPYISTIAVLTFTAMRKNYISKTPKALGEAYHREERR